MAIISTYVRKEDIERTSVSYLFLTQYANYLSCKVLDDEKMYLFNVSCKNLNTGTNQCSETDFPFHRILSRTFSRFGAILEVNQKSSAIQSIVLKG